MIKEFWHKHTSPTTKYEKGHIANSKQAEAATKVGKLEALVRDIGDSMAAIDETYADQNGNSPNSVYGSVYTRQCGSQGTTPFTGSCQLKDGQVTRLEVSAGSTSLSVSSQGDRQEIHYVNKIAGSCADPGPNVLEEHEWAVSDGSHVKYKSYTYFSYGDS